MIDTHKGKEFLSGLGISIVLLFLGYISNPILGQFTWFKLLWPTNVYAIAVVLVFGVIMALVSNSTVLKQLTSFWTMLASMIVVTASGIYLFIFPLKDGTALFNYIDGVGLLFVVYYLFFACGNTIIHQLSNRRWFTVLAYIGFLIFVFSTVVGQHDYYKMQMRTGTDRAIFSGQNFDGSVYRTPFAIKFLGIEMQEEPAVLVVLDESGQMESDSVNASGIGATLLFDINSWKVEIINYLPNAVLSDSGYVASDNKKSIQAAEVKVFDSNKRLIVEGWISSGMEEHRPRSLNIDGIKSLGLRIPLNTNYKAKLRVFETATKYVDYQIKNGEELKLKGWAITLEEIDERYGSQTPVIDLLLIFDRWIELKYIGLALLFIALLFGIKRP